MASLSFSYDELWELSYPGHVGMYAKMFGGVMSHTFPEGENNGSGFIPWGGFFPFHMGCACAWVGYAPW
jgi:hypothetical protein